MSVNARELLALSQADLMGMARNPLRNDADRLAAWHRFNVLVWTEAHVERDLPMSAIPKEYRDDVYEELKRAVPLRQPNTEKDA